MINNLVALRLIHIIFNILILYLLQMQTLLRFLMKKIKNVSIYDLLEIIM